MARHETYEPLDSERTCPVCGKTFWVPDVNWAYKRYLRIVSGNVWFCSWKCMRKYEEGTAELKGRGKKMSNRARVVQALEDGLTIKEIAMMLDLHPETIRWYKRGIAKEKEQNEQQTSSESSSETH